MSWQGSKKLQRLISSFIFLGRCSFASCVVRLVKVILHYGPPLTVIIGKAKEEVIVKKGSTVLSLLKDRAIKHGDVFKDYIFSNYERNQVNEGIIISLNAKRISNETKNIKIKNDDFIAIYSPVGGG